jgi:flavin-dependent dehydrogenase
MKVVRHHLPCTGLDAMSAYDITIAGAGPAGSVLALLAARARYRVLLVEKSHFDRPRFGETAPPELRQALTRVGLERLAQAPFCREAPEVLSVWGSDEPWSRHHIFSPYGTALHLDRRAFDEALALAARDAGADLKLGCAARFAAQPRGGYIVQLSTGESIRANAAILATGRVGGASAFRMCVNTWTTTSRSLRVSRCPRGISTRGR